MHDTTIEHRRLPAAGLTLDADVAGNLQGQHVVLLHGGGQTRHAWRGTLRSLVARGYHVISLDLRGHGGSDWAADGDYCFDAFVADLRAIIADFAHPPVLVGASLGGLTSLLAIGEAGSDVQVAKALILVDVTPTVARAGASEIRAFMNSNPDGFASVEEAADAVSRYLPHRPRPDDISGLRRNLRLGEDGRYRWHWDPAFLKTGPAVAQDSARLERAAARVKVPTLLVRGGLSRVVDDAGAQRLLELIPQSEVVIVQGADHMVAGDRNDVFTQALLAFLQRHAPARID